MAAKNDRIQGLIARYQAAVIIGVRFAYGLRIAGPVLIGMSSVSGYRFTLLYALSAVLWACLIAGIVWVFGHAAEVLLGEPSAHLPEFHFESPARPGRSVPRAWRCRMSDQTVI